jgi:predicted enzyme related to lactoylglutathione lyase
MANLVVWCDIPVLDLERAIRFYSQVLNVKIEQNWPGMKVGVFQHGETDVSGCLYEKPGEQPSETGPLLYLNVQGRLDEAIALVETNGGKILQPKHAIGPYGQRAIVKDSEGNRVALHSM